MRRFVVLSIILMLGVAAMAADSTKTAQTGMPPMGPPPEMKLVAFLVGTWDATMKFTMGDTTKWEESKGVSKWEPIADGAALLNTFESSMMQMPMKGYAMTAFNRETGKWQTSWLDNMMASISLYQGDFTNGKLTVAGEDMMQGKKYITRITMYNITPTSFDQLFEVSADGGKTFMVNGKGTYAKRK
jgi:hypothetical protein